LRNHWKQKGQKLLVFFALFAFFASSDSPSSPQCISGGLCLVAGAAGAQEAVRLDSGNPVEREIAGGQTHIYGMRLSAGQFVHLIVEQNGIDLAVEFAPPDGKHAETINFTRAGGRESFSYEAAGGGDHRVTIRPFGPYARAGNYRMRLETRAAATDVDRQRIAAERAMTEAFRLSRQGTVAAQQVLAKAQEALALWREIGDRYSEADALGLVGYAHILMSRFEPAMEYCQQAVSVARETDNRFRLANALSHLGRAYNTLGRPNKGIELFEQSLAAYRENQDKDGQITALNGLGISYRMMSRYDEQVEYLEQALRSCNEFEDRAGSAPILLNLGGVYYQTSRYDKAIEFYEQALAIGREIKDRDIEGRALNNLGLAYRVLNRYERAIEYLEQALAIHRETRERTEEGVTLRNLGYVYLRQNRHDLARGYFEQALPIHREVKDRFGEGYTLGHLGEIHSFLKNHDKAIEYLDQALAVMRQVGDRQGESYTLNVLGEVHLALRRYDQAIERFEQSLSIRREVGYRFGEAASLHGLARAERERGNLDRARALIEQCLRITESLRSEIYNQASRAAYFGSARDYHEFHLDLLMRLDQANPAQGFKALAIEASERARARGLLELLTEAGVDIRRGVEASLLESERRLARELNAAAQRRTQRNMPEQAAALAKEISRLENDYEQAQAAIRRASPRYAALVQPLPLKLDEIQRQLDDGALLLEYSLGAERSFLWAVTGNSLTSHELPGEAEIRRATLEVYGLLTARSRAVKGETPPQRRQRIAQAETQLPEAAGALGRMLLSPVAAQLGAQRLVIVADGVLQYLPFAMLPRPETERRRDGGTGGGRDRETERGRGIRTQPPSVSPSPRPFVPLIVNHEVINLPSASALAVQRRELAARRPAPKMVAVIADPVFSASDERMKTGVAIGSVVEAPTPDPANTRIIEHLSDDPSSGDARKLAIPRLPFTRQEAERILALAPLADSFKATSFTASRATVTGDDLGQYRYVHFATHGLLDSERPGLSSLLLSLVDEQGRPQDGFLRAHDVYNLKLPAELVVLSACQTGLGKEIKGEGLIGLTRGFMYAGAARVAVSLWSVNDQATSELMARFYQKMLKENQRPAAALRAAQVEMWKQKQWQAPYYWAAFILQGEWR
jgi:CHAT domain-containing protein/Tfp pilus assembly protein PilF